MKINKMHYISSNTCESFVLETKPTPVCYNLMHHLVAALIASKAAWRHLTVASETSEADKSVYQNAGQK